MPRNWLRRAGYTNVNPRRLLFRLVLFVSVSICFVLVVRRPTIVNYFAKDERPYSLPGLEVDQVARIASYYVDEPVSPPYKEQFWEVGQRLRQVATWLLQVDQLNRHSPSRKVLLNAAESVSVSVAPFLTRKSTKTPFRALRKSFKPGSRGIVISVGGGGGRGSDGNVRYAGHLISSLRIALDCQLPIQIAYAGERDLPKADRDRLQALDATGNISFLDVLSIFNDSTLKLRRGGWAVKAFAALASKFEQVIVLDADSVFLQKPEVLFDQQPYRRNGAYLFHDRLLWQGSFQDRHEWWRDQIKEPSPALNESLVWTEDYAEECDSGVVVLDKSRPEVLMGLLHVTWQNTYDVREEVTYKLTYGDKESWWLGLELAGSGYQFESHYGSIVGWEGRDPKSEDPAAESDRVCSFVIAHMDDKDRLIWYNGSLLKNKLVNPNGYEVPTVWMMDGKWLKGRTKRDMSCMTDAPVKRLGEGERRVLEKSIKVAKGVDSALATP